MHWWSVETLFTSSDLQYEALEYEEPYNLFNLEES